MKSFFVFAHILRLTILVSFVTNAGYAQTFNGVGNLPVPPVGTTGITQSPCSVSGVGILGGCVKIDYVTLDLVHTWVGDIGILLIGPNGTFIELSTGNGGPGDNFQVTTFDDSAPTFITSGAPPYNGTYRPEGRQNTTLTNPYPNTNPVGTFTFQNTFNGINADGTWTLYINDYVGADSGILNNWSITFETNGQNFTVNAGPDQSICAGQSITLTATNTATNPTYSWSTGDVTQSTTFCCLASSDVISVTVTDQSGCTASDNVLVTVTPAPVGNPITINACEISGTGQSMFNLPSFNSSIGSGTINWYFDIGLTLPIPNPSNLLTSSTIVYATVSVGICTSPPIPITLVVTTANPAEYDMDIVEDAVCVGSLFSVLFTLPAPGVYTYEYTLTCGSTSTTSFITTSSNPIFFSSNVGCVLSISKITPQGGCPVIFTPELSDVISIIPSPTFTYLPINICAGTTIDLLDYISVTPNGTITFHTSLPPTPANQLPSSVITPTATVNLIATTNICDATAGFPVVVIPGGIPFDVDVSVCENEGLINLNQFLSPSNLTGTWSGQGVSGNVFNPIGLSGPVSVTFDPTETCYENGNVTFQVTAQQTPVLFTTQICESSPTISLIPLQDPLFMSGTWAGTGVSGTSFDPDNLSGDITLTFTPSNSCSNPASTIITILPTPDLTIQQNIIVCNGTTVDLINYVDGVSGLLFTFHAGLPATSSNQILNTSVTVNGTITYYVKGTDITGCFRIEGIVINTTPGGTPILGTESLCQSGGNYNLNLLNDGNVGPGTWFGNDVTNNSINLIDQSGIILLTFVPDNDCFTAATTSITVAEVIVPNLGTVALCASSGDYDLSNIADQNFTNGTWSGPGVINNIFNPSSLQGTISLTFIANDFCTSPSNTIIDVIPSALPILSSIQLCETSDVLSLTNLQDSNFPVGLWSGNGVTGSIFDPSGNAGVNTLTFLADVACSVSVQTTVTVNLPQTPQLQGLNVCESNSSIDLITLTDPNFTTGTWAGLGVTNNIFDPNGQKDSIRLSFVSSLECTNPATTYVVVNEPPSINDFTISCSPDKSSYLITFEILGGDTSTYEINGFPVPSQFVSPLILSGQAYNFFVTDINRCDIINLQGSKNCECTSYPGTLNFANSPIKACSQDSITAIFNNDNILDSDDGISFVLHDGDGTQLGNILAMSDEPIFGLPSSGQIGITYYISSMVGNILTNGNIDIGDPCFSISAGVPVTFYKPDISLSVIDNFCLSQSINIPISTIGESPFSIEYEINNGLNSILKDTIKTISNNTNFFFSPSNFNVDVTKTFTINIIRLSDKFCDVYPNTTRTFNINPSRKNLVKKILCQNESLTINGTVYDQSKSKGQEVILTTNAQLCDSIIDVDLTFLKNTEFTIIDSICKQQSIIINGITYNESKLTGTEIITNNAGCDSIINIKLTLVDDIAVNIYNTLCQGEFIKVNGKTYDINNPIGQEIINASNNNSCDSIINVKLDFLLPKEISINPILCKEDSITINNRVYNFSNSSGIEIIKNGALNGCDSTVNIKLSFFSSDIDSLKLVLKRGESRIINGVEFNENFPEGKTQLGDLTENGCTKYQYVTITFMQDVLLATITSQNETCPQTNDGSITINSISGCSNYQLIIDNEKFSNIKLPFTIADLAPKNYIIEIIGDVGCIYKDTVSITASASTGFTVQQIEFIKNYDDDLFINLSIQPKPSSISWDFSEVLSCIDCYDPTISRIETDTTLSFRLLDGLGCTFYEKISIDLIINEPDVILPNIFSPNGDGVNDVWEITIPNGYTLVDVNIYDRWGNNIFTKNQHESFWNGYYNNQSCESGIYIYSIFIKRPDGRKLWKTGDISLIR